MKKLLITAMLMFTSATVTVSATEYEELEMVNGGSIKMCTFVDDFSKHTINFSLVKTNGKYERMISSVIPSPYVESSTTISETFIEMVNVIAGNLERGMYSSYNELSSDNSSIVYGMLVSEMDNLKLYVIEDRVINYNVIIDKDNVHELVSCTHKLNELTKTLNGKENENTY